jgi:hypothetical protein
MDDKIRLPNQMKAKEKKLPVSTRLSLSTKAALTKEAEKVGIPLAMLVSNVMDDYVKMLQGKTK